MKAEESSTVLEHKQDVFICAVTAPRIFKILETGAAHPWKPPQNTSLLTSFILNSVRLLPRNDTKACNIKINSTYTVAASENCLLSCQFKCFMWFLQSNAWFFEGHSTNKTTLEPPIIWGLMAWATQETDQLTCFRHQNVLTVKICRVVVVNRASGFVKATQYDKVSLVFWFPAKALLAHRQKAAVLYRWGTVFTLQHHGVDEHYGNVALLQVSLDLLNWHRAVEQ